MPSDFSNIRQSGNSCVGCGKTSDAVNLVKLRTYSLSLCCYECMLKYRACSNDNLEGKRCNHDPHIGKPCKHCGCVEYMHGLQGEYDRQYAAGVGVAQRFHECQGFGTNLGMCGTVILAGADGTLSRLCEPCMRLWLNETKEAMREFQLLQKIDTKIEFPN